MIPGDVDGLPAAPNGAEPLELEAVDEPETGQEAALLDGEEFARWSGVRLDDPLPCLFLDANLRILFANRSAADLYRIPARLPGLWFTQFAAPHFDETRSAELFRAVRSADAGNRWIGTIERTDTDQLLGVYKVWILPLAHPADLPARAFQAICLDISPEYRSLVQGTFDSLLEVARRKDNDTGQHIERVNRYARDIASDLHGRPQWPEVNRQFIASISQAAALHDVGKIGTPDDILNKVGTLDPWEWEIMKEHTKNGAYILRRYHIPMASEIALRHHERWDGTGYPYGLEGIEIPLSARIVAIADVYDALRMRRTYKEPYPHDRAVGTIADERGRHFDPLLVDRFLAFAPSFARIFSELLDPA
jgi:HD-GYP domain-containing protein (c-di-GMP phosphodiesterase class II)